MIVIKKTPIILCALLFCVNNLKAQITYYKDTIYIYEENPVINADLEGILHYYITIKSQDSLFNTDSYKFIIPNKTGFDKRAPLKELGKVVDLKALPYIEKNKLVTFQPCDLHKFFSIKQEVYLIETQRIKKYNDNSGDKLIYVMYPIRYKGTEKNTELLKLH